METPSLQQNLLKNLPKPEPMPNEWAYKLERWKCLALSSRKLKNYMKYMRSARRSEDLEYLPIKLDIENVSRCNFRCTMCQVSGWANFKRADDMSFEDFKNLIDEQYGLVEIKIQGMGEPTLAKDTYFNMLKYARSKHIWVRTVTNASLLHLHDNYKKIVDSGANEIQISVDGATKETFENIRQGSNFEKVSENCKLINDYCKTKKILRTKMWTVVQKDNLTELSDLVKLGHELGFTSMVLALDLNGWGQEKWNNHANEVKVENQVTYEYAKKLVDKGEDLGIKVTFWNNTSKFNTASKETLCHWPFERAYVSSDMKIVPCCMIANPEVKNLGDAHNFTQEWNSKNYKEFRKAHLEGKIPNICKECYKNSSS